MNNNIRDSNIEYINGISKVFNIEDDKENIKDNNYFRNKPKLYKGRKKSIIFSNSLSSSFFSETNKNQYNNISSFFSSKNKQQPNLENSYISQDLNNLSVPYYDTGQNILRQLNYNMNTSNLNNKETYENKKRKKFELRERYVINENFPNSIDGINL